MGYPDRFLKALGAWQNGWREDKDRRVAITAELLTAINELSLPLPKFSPPELCYRKRFLVPNNPQNQGDFVPLLINGAIEEGVSSWTTVDDFARDFKDLFRRGCITAIFEHLPSDDEVVVDVAALWNDYKFRSAVESYASRQGKFHDALNIISHKQGELILNAPLLASEVVDFVGFVGEDTDFFEAFAATTDAEKDVVWKAFADVNSFPGDAKWSGRRGAQRAIQRAREKYFKRLSGYRWHSQFRRSLLGSTQLRAPKSSPNLG
jgi:hypothetical protein